MHDLSTLIAYTLYNDIMRRFSSRHGGVRRLRADCQRMGTTAGALPGMNHRAYRNEILAAPLAQYRV